MASPRSGVNLNLYRALDLGGDRARAEAAEARSQELRDYEISQRPTQEAAEAAEMGRTSADWENKIERERLAAEALALKTKRANEAYLLTEEKRKSDKKTNDQAQIAYLVRRFGANNPRTLDFIRRVGNPEYGVTTARETPEGGVELYGNLSEDEPGTNLVYALNKGQVDWSVKLIESPLRKEQQTTGVSRGIYPSGLEERLEDPLLKDRAARLKAETGAADALAKLREAGGRGGGKDVVGTQFLAMVKARSVPGMEDPKVFDEIQTDFGNLRAAYPDQTADWYYATIMRSRKTRGLSVPDGGGDPVARFVGRAGARAAPGAPAPAGGIPFRYEDERGPPAPAGPPLDEPAPDRVSRAARIKDMGTMREFARQKAAEGVAGTKLRTAILKEMNSTTKNLQGLGFSPKYPSLTNEGRKIGSPDFLENKSVRDSLIAELLYLKGPAKKSDYPGSYRVGSGSGMPLNRAR